MSVDLNPLQLDLLKGISEALLGHSEHFGSTF